MERSKKIVLEAPEGYNFDVSSSEGGCLRITLIPTVAGNYTNPPIPEGWEHVEGEWNNGFVIQDYCGNQFVWVPVDFLDANGTFDGSNFTEKFGRRRRHNTVFGISDYKEELRGTLFKQFKSVQKYGGFYISRYKISNDKGVIRSVQGKKPCTNINCSLAMHYAECFGNGTSVRSHLTYGAEYDSMLEWFQKTQAKNKGQWEHIERNDSMLANNTGECELLTINHICDFAGRVKDWTQEQFKDSGYVVRGFFCFNNPYDEFPTFLRIEENTLQDFRNVGFRATLCLA